MVEQRLAAMAVVTMVSAMPMGASAQTVSAAETQAIAKDAYVYSYAMLESYQTWRKQTVDKSDSGYIGGFNVYRHYSDPCDARHQGHRHAEQRHAVLLGMARPAH